MWAHATPVMLYTLSMISDFTSKQARQRFALPAKAAVWD